MASNEAEVVDLTGEEDEEVGLPPAPNTAEQHKRKAEAEAGEPAGPAQRREIAAPAAEPAEPIVGGAKRAPVKEPTAEQGRERMHALLRRFHLEPDSVNALLASTRDLVAGGAPLYAFMGQPVDAFAGDLDAFCQEPNLPLWRQLLEGAGYRFRPFQRRGETVVPDTPSELMEKRLINAEMEQCNYPPGVNGVVQVLDFVRGSGSEERKVQVVVCLDTEKVLEGFDLSAAATSWNGRSLETRFPWLTRRWLTFWQWEEMPLGRSHNAARLAKYESKGFTLLPDGGPRVEVSDDPYFGGVGW